MREIVAVVVGIVCMILFLIPLGFIVCLLAMMTNGSMPVIVAASGLSLSLAGYGSYRAARAVLGGRHGPPIDPLPPEKQGPRRE
jgi:ABC-type transport system involved in multi-copper enzyme maturation permease subunit